MLAWCRDPPVLKDGATDDEAGEAARGRQEEVMDVTDGTGANVSNESGRSTKVTKRGRPKKTPVDMTFSSGKLKIHAANK